MKVSGYVKDETGLPYENAHVFLKSNPSIGTYTDARGYFYTDVFKENDIISFSHVESNQGMALNIGTNTNIQMELIRIRSFEELELTFKKKTNYWFLIGLVSFGVYKFATKKEIKKVKI